jgi:hypothetical protein
MMRSWNGNFIGAKEGYPVPFETGKGDENEAEERSKDPTSPDLGKVVPFTHGLHSPSS